MCLVCHTLWFNKDMIVEFVVSQLMSHHQGQHGDEEDEDEKARAPLHISAFCFVPGGGRGVRWMMRGALFPWAGCAMTMRDTWRVLCSSDA